MYDIKSLVRHILDHHSEIGHSKYTGTERVTRKRSAAMAELNPIQFTDANGDPVDPKYGVCCLAMHFRPEHPNDSDTARILSMLQNLAVDGVLSAGWGVQKYPGFVPCDFRYVIPTDVCRACHKHAKVVVLDYFYLPAHYYDENYGTNWISEKVHALLQGSVECVILPYDRLGEERNLPFTGSLREQIERAKDSGLYYFNISWSEAENIHPLVKASGPNYLQFIASGTNKQISISARDNYLNPSRAFAVFHRQDRTRVTELLKSLCKT